MAASVFNFTIEKGVTLRIPMRVMQGKAPMPLTGYQGFCQIRTTADYASTIIATPTINIVDAPGGLIEIYLSEETTAAIRTTGKKFDDYTEYQYDIKLKNMTTGQSFRIFNGSVKVSPGVTSIG
jgi:hypothetical protein